MIKILEYLPLMIPIVLIPFVMRFIISPIIFFKLKNKYLKKITSTFGQSWFDPKELEAIEFLKNYAWKDLSRPYVLSYNSNRLKSQFKALFIGISSIYNKDKNSISMEFSMQKLLEAFYLLFEEVHKDFRALKLFNILEKLPINIFLRASEVNKTLRIFTRNKIIMRLNKYRITVKLLRILIIPIFGLPIIITQLFFSLLYSTLFEGYLRFIYGIILLKVGYYTIYIYSDRNSSLYSQDSFNKKQIIERAKVIQERHTKFSNRYIYTNYLENALKTLKQELEKNEIPVDEEMDDRKLIKLSKRIFDTIRVTLNSEFNEENKSRLEIKPLIEIFNKIGSIYFPKSSAPLFNIRVKEVLEFGYFFTTISLKNIYTIPGFRKLMDKIPLKLILDINEIIGHEKIKEVIPYIKKGRRVLSNMQNYYLATRTLLKRGNPAIFAATMVTPLIYQHSLISIKEYVYNVSSLLLIDSYESTVLRSNKSRIEKK